MAEQKVELRKVRDFSENLNDTIAFIRQNFKPLLGSFVAIAGVFMLVSAILSGLYQSQYALFFKEIFMGKRANPEFAATNMLDGRYFLVIMFSWLNFVAMQVAVISYMKVYDVKNQQTPEIVEVWDVFKQHFFKVFFLFNTRFFAHGCRLRFLSRAGDMADGCICSLQHRINNGRFKFWRCF